MKGRGGFAGQGKKRGAPFSKGGAQADGNHLRAQSVYFYGLPPSVTDSDVRAECAKYASVKNVMLNNGKALVLLMTPEDAQKVAKSAVIGTVHGTLAQRPAPATQRPTEPSKTTTSTMPNMSIFGSGTTNFFSFGTSAQKESDTSSSLDKGNDKNKVNGSDETKTPGDLFSVPKGFGFGASVKTTLPEAPSKQQKADSLFGMGSSAFGLGETTPSDSDKRTTNEPSATTTTTQFGGQEKDTKGLSLNMPNLSVFGSVATTNKKAGEASSVFSFGTKTQLPQQRPAQKQTKYPNPFGQQQHHATAEMLSGKESRLERFAEQDEAKLQDRIDVLTAERDKELKLMMNSGAKKGNGTQKNTADGHKSRGIKGLCQDMCPELERLKRVKKKEFEVFEAGPDGTPDQSLMVKRYHRNNTVFPASELRPEPVLKRTLTHLLDYVLPRSKDFYETYTYIRDRMRSLRQDMICQSICSDVSIEILECNARFHIISYQKCCCRQGFDFKQNTENLTQCITTLNDQYKYFRAIGRPCVHEAEFYAYRLIHDPKPSDVMQEIPQYLFSRPPIQFALRVVGAIAENNFWRFFELVRMAPFRMASLLLTRFTEVRKAGLERLRNVHDSLPLSFIVKSFGFQDATDARDTLIALGYSVDQNDNFNTKQYEPKDAPPALADNQRLVGSKEGNRSLKDLITRGDGTFNSKFDQVPPCSKPYLDLFQKQKLPTQESVQVDSTVRDMEEIDPQENKQQTTQIPTEESAPKLNVFATTDASLKEQESSPKESVEKPTIPPPESQTLHFGTSTQPFSLTSSIFGSQPKNSFDLPEKQKEQTPFSFAETSAFTFSQPQVSTANDEGDTKETTSISQTTETKDKEKQEENPMQTNIQPQQGFMFQFNSIQQNEFTAPDVKEEPKKPQEDFVDTHSPKQSPTLQEPQQAINEEHEYEYPLSQNASIDTESASIDFACFGKEECSTPLCSRSNKDKNEMLQTEESVTPIPFQIQQEDKVCQDEDMIEEQKETPDEDDEKDVCDKEEEYCEMEQQEFWNFDEKLLEEEILVHLSQFCDCGFLKPGQLWTVGIKATERDVFIQMMERKLSQLVFQNGSSAFKVKFFEQCDEIQPHEISTIQTMLFYISPKSKSGWDKVFKTDLETLKQHGICGGSAFVLFGCEPDGLVFKQAQETFGVETGFEVLDGDKLQQLMEQQDYEEVNNFFESMISELFSQMVQFAPSLPEQKSINVQEFVMEMINSLLRKQEVAWTSPDVYVKLFNATISAVIDEICPDDESTIRQWTTFHSLCCFANEEQQRHEEQQIEQLRVQLRGSRLPFVRTERFRVQRKGLIKAFESFMETLQKNCNCVMNTQTLSSALALGDHIHQLLCRHFPELNKPSEEQLKSVLPAVFYEIFQWRIMAFIPSHTAYFVQSVTTEELQERIGQDLNAFLKEAQAKNKRSKQPLPKKRPSTPAGWDDETFSPALKRPYGTTLKTPSRTAAANQRLATILLTQVRTQKKQWTHTLF